MAGDSLARSEAESKEGCEQHANNITLKKMWWRAISATHDILKYETQGIASLRKDSLHQRLINNSLPHVFFVCERN